VTINDEMPADRKSAECMLKRIKLTKIWTDKTAIWSSKEYKLRALDSIKKARVFYQRGHDSVDKSNNK
jgi:hypothetical protein